jgi:hypothetical protein
MEEYGTKTGLLQPLYFTPQLARFLLIILLNTSYKSGVQPSLFFEGADPEAI